MSRDYNVLPSAPWATLGVVSAGGVLGGLARFGLVSAFPEPPGSFAWPVFWINTSGCLLIGIVVVIATELRSVHRLVRPFLATGVLGGFTTFSTYISGMQRELAAGAARTALLYGAATLLAALAAAWAGVRLAAGVTEMVRRVAGPPGPDPVPAEAAAGGAGERRA
jgi:fluoride exporter